MRQFTEISIVYKLGFEKLQKRCEETQKKFEELQKLSQEYQNYGKDLNPFYRDLEREVKADVLYRVARDLDYILKE